MAEVIDENRDHFGIEPISRTLRDAVMLLILLALFDANMIFAEMLLVTHRWFQQVGARYYPARYSRADPSRFFITSKLSTCGLNSECAEQKDWPVVR